MQGSALALRECLQRRGGPLGIFNFEFMMSSKRIVVMQNKFRSAQCLINMGDYSAFQTELEVLDSVRLDRQVCRILSARSEFQFVSGTRVWQNDESDLHLRRFSQSK